MIKDAEAQTGDARQDALAEVFAEEPDEVGQYAYLAHMNGVLGIGEGCRLRAQLRHRRRDAPRRDDPAS